MNLGDFIATYDKRDSKGWDEYQIASHIWNKDATGDLFYEGLAFEFGEYPDGKGWGQFYGARAAVVTQDGQRITNIVQSQICQSAIDYWDSRSQSAVNPVF